MAIQSSIFLNRGHLCKILLFLILFGSTMRVLGQEVGGLINKQDTINRDANDFITASLLIAEPGDVLYSCVGHCAIRMQCPTFNHDFVFTYESEDVSQRVLTFLVGNLKMGMRAVHTANYLQGYQEEQRCVMEYELNLSPKQKQHLWQVLDKYLVEGQSIPYNYMEYGCAYSTFKFLKQAVEPSVIAIDAFPESFKHLNRRELTRIQTRNSPWNWFFMNIITNGMINEDCTMEEKIIMPNDLLYVLQHAYVDGQPLMGGEKKLVDSVHHSSQTWISPFLLSILVLVLSVIGLCLRKQIFAYVVFACNSVIGAISLYLMFFTSLVCTEWSPLVIPFCPLPFMFWKWRRYWIRPYIFIIALWIVILCLWPHELTEKTFYVLALAQISSLINIDIFIRKNHAK